MRNLRRTNPPPRIAQSAWLQIALVSAIAAFLSVVSEPLADSVRIPIGCWLIMRAKPDALIGLVILYLSRNNFYLIEDFTSMGAVSERATAPESLRVLGFPVNLPTLNCAFVALRVIWERMNRPETFTRKIDWWFVNLWMIALLPAVVAFLVSYQERNENWTRGMRFYLLAASYFYGLILVRNSREACLGELTIRLVGFMGVMLVLMNAAVYWSHHGFLFVAGGIGMGVHLIATGRGKLRFMGLILFALGARYAMSSTFTLLASGLVAALFSVAGWIRRSTGAGETMIRWSGKVVIAAALLFSVVVVEYARFARIGTDTFSAGADASLNERLVSKMFADRLALWQPASDQIWSGPYFLVPSGRPLTVKEFGVDDWTVGAHNVTLEVIRNSGLLLGFVILGIYVISLSHLLRVIAGNGNAALGGLASGLFGVAVAGIATGDFPADMTVGVFIWMLGGAVCELDAKLRSEPRNVASRVVFKANVLGRKPRLPIFAGHATSSGSGSASQASRP